MKKGYLLLLCGILLMVAGLAICARSGIIKGDSADVSYENGDTPAEALSDSDEPEKVDPQENVVVIPLIPDWITADISDDGYYYDVDVADGEPEATFLSYGESEPDFIKITPEFLSDESLTVLNANQTYEFHMLVGHESEALENVSVSLGYCWLTGTQLRFLAEITYGDGNRVTYAEEFVVEVDGDKHYGVSYVPKADIFTLDHLQTFGGPTGDILGGEPILVSSNEDGAALLGGMENAREICFTINIVPIPTKAEPAVDISDDVHPTNDDAQTLGGLNDDTCPTNPRIRSTTNQTANGGNHCSYFVLSTLRAPLDSRGA